MITLTVRYTVVEHINVTQYHETLSRGVTTVQVLKNSTVLHIKRQIERSINRFHVKEQDLYFPITRGLYFKSHHRPPLSDGDSITLIVHKDRKGTMVQNVSNSPLLFIISLLVVAICFIILWYGWVPNGIFFILLGWDGMGSKVLRFCEIFPYFFYI